MTVAASWQDLYNLGRAELQLRRPDLFAEPGDITDFILAAAAAMADKNEATAARLFSATFVDTSTGQDLTILADDHWGVVRQAATPALVTLTFHRASSGAGAGSIPAGTVVATAIDALGRRLQFTTNTTATYGALETGDKSVAATCTTTGKDGNVAIGTLVLITSTLFDSSITVNNASPNRAAGGAEQETDDALRERVRTFPSVLRRGTLAALEYGARTVPGVATATAFEGPTGLVTVYVADSSGGSNAELNALVQAEMENWRAAGTSVTVQSAVILTQDITADILAKPGFVVVEQLALLQAAVTGRMAKLVMGESLFLDELKAAIIAVAPDQIRRVRFSVPADDVVLSGTDLNRVIRAGSITLAQVTS